MNSSISSNILTLTPIDDQYGTTQISIIANDGILDSPVSTFNLTIDNVNDPPLLADINNQVTDEDSSNIVINVTPTDVDLEDTLILSVTSSNES